VAGGAGEGDEEAAESKAGGGAAAIAKGRRTDAGSVKERAAAPAPPAPATGAAAAPAPPSSLSGGTSAHLLHRLDRLVSGLVPFASDADATGAFIRARGAGGIAKAYVALLSGDLGASAAALLRTTQSGHSASGSAASPREGLPEALRGGVEAARVEGGWRALWRTAGLDGAAEAFPPDWHRAATEGALRDGDELLAGIRRAGSGEEGAGAVGRGGAAAADGAGAEGGAPASFWEEEAPTVQRWIAAREPVVLTVHRAIRGVPGKRGAFEALRPQAPLGAVAAAGASPLGADLGGKEAETLIIPLAIWLADPSVAAAGVAGGGLSLTAALLLPRTGRTHQLRVHSQSVGHPIANDVV
jgi:hypothetical protein